MFMLDTDVQPLRPLALAGLDAIRRGCFGAYGAWR